MLISYKRGQTSVVLRIKIRNSSTGNGKTGLTSSSTGLIISTIQEGEATATTYTAAGSTIESITTLGTYAAPTATKCRFKEVDATNHPGIYEIQIADARFSTGRSILVSVNGVSGTYDADALIPLWDVDPYDAVRGLSGTALPNANAGANGGLPTGDANAAVKVQSGTGTGQLDFTGGVVKANLAQILGSAITGTASQIAAAFRIFFDVGSPTLTTASVNQTGDSFARLGAPAGASISADIATVNGKLPSALNGNGNIKADVVDWKGATAPANTGDAYARLGTPTGATIAADIAAALASILSAISSVPTSVWNFATRTLSAFGFTVAPTVAQIRTEMDDNSADLNAIQSSLGTLATAVAAIPTTPAPTVVQIRQEIDSNSVDLDAIQSALTTLASAVAAIPTTPAPTTGQIVTAIDASSADLNTIISGIASVLSAIAGLPTPAAPGDAMALTTGERATLAAAILNLTDGVETGITPQQALRAILAESVGVLAGAPTGPITFRDPGDTTDRITATVDGDGNRTAVVLDLT